MDSPLANMELVVFYLLRPDDQLPKLLLIHLVKGTGEVHGLEGCACNHRMWSYCTDLTFTTNHFKGALAKLQHWPKQRFNFCASRVRAKQDVLSVRPVGSTKMECFLEINIFLENDGEKLQMISGTSLWFHCPDGIWWWRVRPPVLESNW